MKSIQTTLPLEAGAAETGGAILQGDCEEVLRGVADDSMDLIFTSPPFADSRKRTYGGIHPDDYVEWFLPKAEQFLRVLEPDSPVVLSFPDAGPDVLGTVFRAVQLNLPDLEPGEYTLTVEVELPGREPMVVAAPIVIVP